MALFFFFILIFLSYRLLRIKILSPLSLTILFSFILIGIIYPILKIYSFNNFQEAKIFISELSEALIIISIIFFFWIIGYMSLGKIKPLNININYRYKDRYFGNFLFILGLFLYFLTYLYTGVDFLSSFNDPLGTRFLLMSKPGAFYLKSLGLWTMWSGWYLNLFLLLNNNQINKFYLIVKFILIILISLPLGQRSYIIFPFVTLIITLHYFNLIKISRIIFLFILMLFIVPILGLYRELGNSVEGFSFSFLVENIETIFANKESIFYVISERLNNLSFFSNFLEFKNSISYDITNSISSFFNFFIPSSEYSQKELDLNTVLTIKDLGSTELGTYAYTPFAEWFLILGNFGYVFFGFFSGLLNRLIINSINKIGYNFFCLVLFSDLFFLKYPFIKINDIDNILLIIFIVYAFFLYLCFNSFRKYF